MDNGVPRRDRERRLAHAYENLRHEDIADAHGGAAG